MRFLLLMVGMLMMLVAPSVARADGELHGGYYGGHWYGSYDTFGSSVNAYCIDPGKFFPRPGYNWTEDPDSAPALAYLLWRYQDTTSNDRAAALSYIVQHSAEVSHFYGPGFAGLPGLTGNAETLRGQMMTEAANFKGAYNPAVFIPASMQTVPTASPTPAPSYTGTARLFSAAGNFPPGIEQVITLTNATFADGTNSKIFAGSDVSFTVRPIKSNTAKTVVAKTVIRGAGTLTVAPGTTVRRWHVPGNGDVQRVITFTGNNYAAQDSGVARPPAAAGGRVAIVKTDQQSGAALAGARFELYDDADDPTQPIDVGTTDANGYLEFTVDKASHVYRFHEIQPPAGYALNTTDVSATSTATDVTPPNPSAARVGMQDRRLQFDLALRKYVHAVNGVPTGQTGAEASPAPTVVKLGDVVTHRIFIYNQNEVAGTATLVRDYLPVGYDFDPFLNAEWNYNPGTGELTSDELATASIAADPTPGVVNGDENVLFIDLDVTVNSLMYTAPLALSAVNRAEICQDANQFGYTDIDSTPDCNPDNDVYGGDNIVDNTNGDEDDHDPDAVVPALTGSTSATTNARLGQPIQDTLTLSITPAGLTVQFMAYNNDTCTGTPAFMSAVQTTVLGTNTYTSEAFTPMLAGDYYWIATASGAGVNYYQGACKETGEITRTYMVATKATAGARLGVQTINDTATVRGTWLPDSQLRFVLYGPGDTTCTTPIFTSDPIKLVVGTDTYASPAFTPTALGTYRWVDVIYDANGTELSRGVCGEPSEMSDVYRLTTQATATAKLGREMIMDTATIAGEWPDNMQARFLLFAPADTTCAGPAVLTSPFIPLVAGTTTYDSPKFDPTEEGTYRWVDVVYDGNGVELSRGVCGDPSELSVVKLAIYDVTTQATERITLGKGSIKDTATVTGDWPDEAHLVFYLYGPGDTKCALDPVFTSKFIPLVRGTEKYTSDPYTPTEEGTYRWVEVLVDSNDKPLKQGKCGETKEISTVIRLTPPTPNTPVTPPPVTG